MVRGIFTWLLLVLSVTSVWAQNAELKPAVKLSADHVWQREQVIVRVGPKTNDPFARLEVDTFTQHGLSIISQVQERSEKMQESSYTLSKQWIVFPFIAGEHRLQLPRIRYRPNRGRIQTLSIPEATLTVKHLPIYVPPTMPVGKISLNGIWDEGILVTNKTLQQWQISVTGEGVAEQTLHPISHQLVSTKNYAIFPARTTQKMLQTQRGITYQRTYTIPFKANKNGRLALPVISVQYFDPASGKLRKTQLEPPFIIALNSWLQWLIALAILAPGITLIITISQKTKLWASRYAQHKKARQLLKNANTYEQAREALKLLSVSQGWKENITLTEFISLWKQNHNSKAKEPEAAIQQLQAYKFSSSRNENEIRQITKRILNNL